MSSVRSEWRKKIISAQHHCGWDSPLGPGREGYIGNFSAQFFHQHLQQWKATSMVIDSLTSPNHHPAVQPASCFTSAANVGCLPGLPLLNSAVRVRVKGTSKPSTLQHQAPMLCSWTKSRANCSSNQVWKVSSKTCDSLASTFGPALTSTREEEDFGGNFGWMASWLLLKE